MIYSCTQSGNFPHGQFSSEVLKDGRCCGAGKVWPTRIEFLLLSSLLNVPHSDTGTPGVENLCSIWYFALLPLQPLLEATVLRVMRVVGPKYLERQGFFTLWTRMYQSPHTHVTCGYQRCWHIFLPLCAVDLGCSAISSLTFPPHYCCEVLSASRKHTFQVLDHANSEYLQATRL